MKKINSNEGKNSEITFTSETGATKDWPALQLDVEYYQAFLDDADIPDEQKKELIETLWNIVVTFVDLGFGIEPVQQAIEAGQNHTQEKILSESDLVKQTKQTDKITSISTEPKEVKAREKTDDI